MFNNQLVKNVVNHEVPINPEILFTEGATNLPNLVPTDDIAPLKAAYSLSVTQVCYPMSSYFAAVADRKLSGLLHLRRNSRLQSYR